MAYAEGTTVAVDKTQAEISKTLKRYGVDGLLIGHERTTAWVQFYAQKRLVKFSAPLPFEHAFPSRRQFEQAERQRWRALLLVIKAKLESIESGIETFEEAFLPHVVLPTGETVKDWLKPQIALAFEQGEMPKMLTDQRSRD